MSWNAFELECFDRVAPAVIHGTPEPDLLAEQAALEEAQAAAEKAAEEERLAREAEERSALLDAISALGARTDTCRAEAAEALAKVLAETTTRLFPSLADSAFAEEMSATIANIVSRADIARARLSVAPDQHARVVSALANLAPEREIAVISNPALSAGMATLDWEAGGAEFDSEKTISAARDVLARRVEAIVRREPENV